MRVAWLLCGLLPWCAPTTATATDCAGGAAASPPCVSDLSAMPAGSLPISHMPAIATDPCAGTIGLYFVAGDSMMPTLLTNTAIPVRCWHRGSQTEPNPPLHAGDIVVFHQPRNTENTLIKRVIGLPGDVIEDSNGIIRLNGHPLNPALVTEPLPKQSLANDTAKRAKPPLDETAQHIIVPPHHVFVLGDNRDNSRDSRSFGPVPTANVIGIAALPPP